MGVLRMSKASKLKRSNRTLSTLVSNTSAAFCRPSVAKFANGEHSSARKLCSSSTLASRETLTLRVGRSATLLTKSATSETWFACGSATSASLCDNVKHFNVIVSPASNRPSPTLRPHLCPPRLRPPPHPPYFDAAESIEIDDGIDVGTPVISLHSIRLFSQPRRLTFT